MKIKLSAPSQAVFLISVVLAALVLINMLGVTIPVVSGNSLLLLAVAYGVLLFGVLVRGA